MAYIKERCRGTQRPNSLLLLFFFCLFISTFSHYTRNRYRHFLFISLCPQTVTLFQICYYPFFIRIYSSVDSLFLVLFIKSQNQYNRKQNTDYRIQKTEHRTHRSQKTEDRRRKTEDRIAEDRSQNRNYSIYYRVSF